MTSSSNTSTASQSNSNTEILSMLAGNMKTTETESPVTKSKSPGKKRKRVVTPTPSKVIDLRSEDSGQELSSQCKKKPKATTPKKNKEQEKRLRRFRQHAPATYAEKLYRATTQRMFVINRVGGGTEDVPEKTIDLAGTTGNIYSVTISQVPSCTCPDNQKGNQCKHIVYVLHNVLKAPEHLQYQLAFLSSELREIFDAAPTPASSSSASPDAPSNRKETVGDCPICFTEFEPDTDEIVWCKAACGNNIHQTCFEQWAKSQAGKELRCVYCRTTWQGDDESLKRIKSAGGKVNEEGYVNVAAELGLSGGRDYSSYHQPWVRRQGYGYY